MNELNIMVEQKKVMGLLAEEIKKLKEQLKESNRRRDIAEECVDYYAKTENWYYSHDNLILDGDYFTEFDVEDASETDACVNIYGGKKARETKAKRSEG